MQKWYLMLVLLATLIIPIRNAANPNIPEAIKKTVLHMAIFVFVWGLGCIYLYWKLPP